jgi:hypothetical protein
MAKKPVSQKQEVSETEPQLVDFNVWFAMREKSIPKQHLKEIIWADFRGQGLSAREELATFDQALVSYGC